MSISHSSLAIRSDRSSRRDRARDHLLHDRHHSTAETIASAASAAAGPLALTVYHRNLAHHANRSSPSRRCREKTIHGTSRDQRASSSVGVGGKTTRTGRSISRSSTSSRGSITALVSDSCVVAIRLPSTLPRSEFPRYRHQNLRICGKSRSQYRRRSSRLTRHPCQRPARSRSLA